MRFALAFITAFAVLFTGSFHPPNNRTHASSCGNGQLFTGGCGVDNSGTSITIRDQRTIPGTPGDVAPPSNPAPPQPPPSRGNVATPVLGTDSPSPGIQPEERCIIEIDPEQTCYERPQEEHPLEEAAPARPATPSTPAMRPTTASDLVTIAPQGALLSAEPGNIGVVGLPANFVIRVSAQTVEAELFGRPVTARFTPAGYDFFFGDGATLSSTTGGLSWEELGQPQFTQTPTTHTYTSRGIYPSRVDIRYSAEVNFGEGWIAVAGEVASLGAEQQVEVLEAHTALVAENCHENPSAPGC